LSFINFFICFGVTEPPGPGNFNPFCGESMDIFWNCTMALLKEQPILGSI